MSASVQCLLCPLNIRMVSGDEVKLEKHMKEKHLVGLGQKGFILAIHLLTKAERDRIELWMTSRKLELSREGEKKEDDKIEQGNPSNDHTGPSNIDADLILIDDEDEEIECCYDSKEQSIDALRRRLFSPTYKKDQNSSSSLEIPYENKTVQTKIRRGRSILKGPETINNEKPAELFDAQAALSKLLKKINEDEKHEEGTIGQLAKNDEKEGIVEIDLETGREKPDKEDAEQEEDGEAGEGVLSIHQSKGQLAKNDEKEDIVDIELEIEREKPHEEDEFEEMNSEEEAKAEDVEQEKDVEDIQARPFNSKIPNLIFSTLF